MPAQPGLLRIGEFARRVGVSPELLRAWERRYGLMQPVRSSGGFRLYTPEDGERVARMRRALDQGLSAAEAARVAVEEAGPSGGSAGPLEDAARRLLDAVHRYDETGIHAVLDECFAGFAIEAALGGVVLPVLVQIGEDWKAGRLGVGEEHFGSNLIRGRLLALGRHWGRGPGPLAVLACAPGEEHDISLVAFGLVLRSYGWRVLFLGTDTPVATLARTAKRTDPGLVVVASFDPALLEAEASALRRLGRSAPLVLAGPGASDPLCERLGVRRLDGDLIAAARDVASSSSA
jgi:DNA-binding transcriptional MerR regulator